MKKLCICFVLLLLTGCSQPEDFETMADTYEEPEILPAESIWVQLPEEAAVNTVQTDGAQLYLCDGYTLELQTLPAGNMQATLRSVTGYEPDRLTVMERRQGELDRYECVWVAAGEGGDQVGRTAILDDGRYHYVLTLMTDAQLAGELAETWQVILDSFDLGEPEPQKS